MNEVIQCPPESVLNEILHRRLGESHVQLLDEHFEQCESCQRRLDCLTPSLETVVEGQTEDTLSEGEQGILQNLIDHLRDHPPEEIGGDSRAGWPTADLRSRSSGTVRFSHDGRVGHYCLVEELGSGASGRLFRAIDERLDRSVALKILRESQMESVEGRRRLEREARAAARLEHDHIVRIYDVSLTGGDPPYIAYELIEGESLSERVHRVGYLSPYQAARIARQIALALNAAHQVGLVHRDVKPSNILLESSTGRAKITDFGLARFDEQQTRLTMEGMIAGTPAYMSPEQILDPHNVDVRSDLYSLGVTMYEMLTGELPFRGVTRMTLMQVLHADPVAIRYLNDEVPVDLETIVTKSIAKDAARRYENAAELADDLQRFLDGETIEAQPAGRIEKMWRIVRRNPRMATLSTMLVVVLMAVAVGSTFFAVKLASVQQEASLARLKAQQDAASAAKQRNLAFKTLQQLAFQVHDDLEESGGDVHQTQLSILKTALDGLGELANSTDSSETADFSTAVAHNRLGMALYGLEHLTEAVAQLRQSLQATGEILETSPNDLAVQRLKVKVLMNLGACLADLGKTEPAGEYLEESILLGQQLLENNPADNETRKDLAGALREMGEVTESLDREKAADLFNQSVTILQNLVAECPGDFDLQHELLTGLYDLGQFEITRGYNEAGHIYLETCILAGENLNSKYPCSHIKKAHALLGKAAAESSNFSEAELHFKKAWQLGKELLEMWPNDEDILQSNSDLELELANIQTELGNDVISRKWLHSSRDTLELLLKNADLLPQQRSQSHGSLAFIALLLKQPEIAEQSLHAAIAEVEHALQEDLTNYEMWQQLWLHCKKLISLASTPSQKRRWLRKAGDVLSQTTQNIDTEIYPYFFEWKRASEEYLDQQEKLLPTEEQSESSEKDTLPAQEHTSAVESEVS